jgi:hypothetical protein
MDRSKETLRELIALLTLAFFASPVSSAFAKVAYETEDAMIRRAEIIAVVDISYVERAKTKILAFRLQRDCLQPSNRRSRDLCHKPSNSTAASCSPAMKFTFTPGVTSSSFFAMRICWSLATGTSASARLTELRLSGMFPESDSDYLFSHSTPFFSELRIPPRSAKRITTRPNQSLEPTAGRCTERLKDEL